jgi:predicted HAD superfamily phosphohydrolase YqeG
MSILELAISHKKALFALYEGKIDIEELTPQTLRNLGAKAVIFDHDGVLGPSRASKPDETGLRLIHATMAEFGKGNVFVLSNSRSRREVRLSYFQKEIPDVGYLVADRKPSREGLDMAVKLSGKPASAIAMVDDGLLTGGAMALEQGAIAVYGVRKNPGAENIFSKAIRVVATYSQIALVRLLAMK